MSDGDNATPGPRGFAGDSTNQWLTRRPPPSVGAAPWERGGVFESRPNHSDSEHGHHSAGISVAELIAKIGADASDGRRGSHHKVDDAPAPALHEPAGHDAVTDRIPVVLPDTPELDMARRRKAEALLRGETTSQTTVLSAIDDEALLGGAANGRTTTLSAVDYEAEPDFATTDPEPERTRHRSALAAGRLGAALLSVIALVLTGAAWQWSASKNNRLNVVSALDPDSRDIVDPSAQFGDENFLIAGVDSRLGDNADMGAGNTADAAGVRSDTVMLVNIPASRKRVVEISFPRDLAITPMLCDAWDPQTGKYGPVYNEDTHSYGPAQVYTETKLNSAYALGGPKCLVKVIQKLSGLAINRFIAVDFVGFAKMVDAVGGVKVCSATPLQDYELGTVLPRAGWQTIDGREALNYVRARQVTTEVNGDYGRIKRQQLFLSSLLRSLISNEVFFSVKKLNDVVNTFTGNSAVDNVKTKDLVELGQSVQGLSAGRVTFLTVPTGVTDSDGNEPLRTEDNRALFDAIINDDALPGENNQNETTTPTTATRTPQASSSPPTNAAPGTDEVVNAVTAEPKTITVHVSNSTGEEGLGASAANRLQQHGFKVLTPDNYPSSLSSTTVFFSSGHEQAAATVASVFPNPQIERVSGMGDVVQVVLGPDFNTVNAPPPTGSPVQVHLMRNDGSPAPDLPQDLSVTNAADVSCQ
jgi:LCP family protein required for cell wall assembly